MRINRNTIGYLYDPEHLARHLELVAIICRVRYWTDHNGQPRRNPTMRPLLHNGKKPR